MLVAVMGLVLSGAAPTEGFAHGPKPSRANRLFTVQVTPDGAVTPARPANTGAYTATFTVAHTGIATDYTILCDVTGPVLSCTASQSTLHFNASGSTTVDVTYSVGAPGVGTVGLSAESTSGAPGVNGGSYTVPVGTFGVAVTPDGSTATTRAANTGGYTESFTVQNTGQSPNTFTISCAGATGVTCGTVPAPQLIQAGASAPVSMPYSVGAAGTGTLTLTATGTAATDQGSYSVPIAPAFSVAVTPDGTAATVRPANTSGYSETFTITNNGAANSYSFTCSGTGGVTCGTVPVPVGPLAAGGGQTTVSMPYSVGAVGTGTLTLTANGTTGAATDNGSYSVPIQVFSVAVTPDAGTAARNANTSGLSESFTVTNNSTASQTFSFVCTASGVVTCGMAPASQGIAGSGAQAAVSMPYSTGVAGTGTLTLRANGPNGSTDTGLFTITVTAVAPPFQVQVTPDGQTAVSRTANTGGYSESFTVTNTGTSANTYSFGCTGAGGVVCGTVPANTASLAALTGQVVVSMPYSVGAAGTGTLTLTANGIAGAATNPGSYSVPITAATTFGVSVLPDGGAAASRTANTGGYSETFMVQNTGSGSNTYSFTCAGAGGVTCGTLPGSVTLAASASTAVAMPYSVGAAGTGTLTLTATGTGATDPGSFSVPITGGGAGAFVPSSLSGGNLVKDTRYILVETANTYDTFGRITQLTDARGKATNYVYGGNITNAFLTKVTRVHDASGPIDLVTDVAYDGSGYVQSIKDEGGAFKRFGYDAFGRLTQVKDNASTVIRTYGYTYSATLANGWTFQPSTPNNVVETTFLQNPGASLVATVYSDGLGRTIQHITNDGANFVVSATQYDGAGRTWRTWKPYNRATGGYDLSFSANAIAAYASFGAAVKPYVETQYTTDPLDRVKQVIPEFVGTSSTVFSQYAYGVNAGVKQRYTELTDESAKKTRSYTNLFGDPVQSILGVGATEQTTTNFAPNIIGERTQATDPRGLATTFTFDTRGLLTARTSPDAGTTSSKYDKAGNLRFVQDANQSAAGQVYFTSYDFAGRPLTTGQGAATFALLDPDAAPTTVETTNTNWLVVRAYDAKPPTTAGAAGFPWNLFTTQITALTLTNVNGRLAAHIAKSNGSWQVNLFSYDADGRVAIRYVYTHANGGTTVLTAVNTTVTYTRNLTDALTQRAMTVGANTFTHWYDYDTRGKLWKAYASTTSTKPGTPDVTYTYRPGGQILSRQFAAGQSVPFTYTLRDQLDQIGDPAIATHPFGAKYTYHPNGTVSQAEFYNAGAPAAAKRYRYDFPTTSYDALNRLTAADFSSWSGTAWTVTPAHDLTGITYDLAGNLVTLQRNKETGAAIDNLTYTNATTSNRLNSVTDAVATTPETWDAETGAFTYDANGNLKTAPAPYGISSVTYDQQNLPIALTANGTTTSYRYDQIGQRITKQVGTGNTEFYLLEGGSPLGVFTVNGAGTLTSWYFTVMAGDKVVGRQPNTGNRLYYHTDLLGSTRSVVTGATVVESNDFDPWGLPMPGRALAWGTKQGFTGKEMDPETGLDYFGARYYMPALARWSQADPAASRHLQWSAYAYALNNPIALVDPDGNCSAPASIKRGQVGICIAAFIAAKRVDIVGLGDNRGPVGDDPKATYRAQVQLVIDPTGRVIVSQRTEAGTSVVLAEPIARKGTASSTISKPAVDKDGNTVFSVALTAANGFSFIPGSPQSIDLNIQLVVTPDGKIGVGGGTRDGYPSLEVFGYDAKGNGTEILTAKEGESTKALAPPQEEYIPPRRPKRVNRDSKQKEP